MGQVLVAAWVGVALGWIGFGWAMHAVSVEQNMAGMAAISQIAG